MKQCSSDARNEGQSGGSLGLKSRRSDKAAKGPHSTRAVKGNLGHPRWGGDYELARKDHRIVFDGGEQSDKGCPS